MREGSTENDTHKESGGPLRFGDGHVVHSIKMVKISAKIGKKTKMLHRNRASPT